MGSKSDYLERRILDHMLGGPDFGRPATVYLALFTAVPDDAGGGTEVSGNGYARAAVANNATNWPAAATDASGNTTKKNGVKISFPAATGSWGNIVGGAIYDAASGGNRLFWASFTAVAINTGDVANFAVNAITLTED